MTHLIGPYQATLSTCEHVGDWKGAAAAAAESIDVAVVSTGVDYNLGTISKLGFITMEEMRSRNFACSSH